MGREIINSLGDSVPFTPWGRFRSGLRIGNLGVFLPAATNACTGCGTLGAFRLEALMSTKRLMDAGITQDEALEYSPLCRACCDKVLRGLNAPPPKEQSRLLQLLGILRAVM